MPRHRSIAEARNTLPQLIRDAEAGQATELTRRGEPVAVLVGLREYERLAAGTRRFSKAWDAFRREVDLSELDLAPEEIFADTRDDSPGRDGAGL